ncbi:hypothetical protein AB834_00855 [PVC group bacterium (ex Bugula neritina AB1)]|nr:hypothetical protein AB834_00855 [PVC group bacterium (ex Bugula neritina AB1)]
MSISIFEKKEYTSKLDTGDKKTVFVLCQIPLKLKFKIFMEDSIVPNEKELEKDKEAHEKKYQIFLKDNALKILSAGICEIKNIWNEEKSLFETYTKDQLTEDFFESFDLALTSDLVSEIFSFNMASEESKKK